jgi:DNA-binding MarR family transcriptional regulator
MKKVIQPGRKAKPAGSAEEAAFLDLLRTCDLLNRKFAAVLKPAELSATQYNVLRILRGAKEPVPCGEIASRMITRDPDITRLLDRMEKRGLVARSRETKDRRMVSTRITAEGLKVLANLDGPIHEAHRAQLGHLGPQRLRQLDELLRAARGVDS